MYSIETVNEKNCNARLSAMYQERDKIGNNIDRLACRGYDTTAAEEKYDEICNAIAEYCEWRRSHPGCLLEGDPGYPYV